MMGEWEAARRFVDAGRADCNIRVGAKVLREVKVTQRLRVRMANGEWRIMLVAPVCQCS